MKSKGLKLGVVLNHTEVVFEIWLLGQTKGVQKKYWNLLKSTKWVAGERMPQYSILDITLIQNPDFDDLDKLTDDLKMAVMLLSDEILFMLKQVD